MKHTLCPRTTTRSASLRAKKALAEALEDRREEPRLEKRAHIHVEGRGSICRIVKNVEILRCKHRGPIIPLAVKAGMHQ